MYCAEPLEGMLSGCRYNAFYILGKKKRVHFKTIYVPDSEEVF